MKNIILTTASILLAGIILWIFIGGHPDEDNTAADIRRVSGEIVEINTSQIAFDGPVLVSIEGDNGSMQLVSIPSFGFNLCAASDDIVDPFELIVGDLVEVSGQINAAGEIALCSTADDYLRRSQE